MNKLIFPLSLICFILLISFSKNSSHPIAKIEKSNFSCPTPANLLATKNGTQVTLEWTCSPAVNCSYGGYYNYIDGNGNPANQNFGSSTNTWPVAITVPSSTYSLRFSVTSNCSDGTHGYSGQQFFNF